MNKLKQWLSNKGLYYGLAIILELIIIGLVITQLGAIARNYYYVVSTIISLIALLYIMNSPIIPEYKIAWIVPVLILPLLGVVLYLIMGRKNYYGKNKKFYYDSIKLTNNRVKQDQGLLQELVSEDKFSANLAHYVYHESLYPLAYGDDLTYFKEGLAYFEALKAELAKAKKFIFLEYFIIADGLVFKEILAILKQKVEQGVDVRLIYDDFGSLLFLKDHHYLNLVKTGIKVVKFNPIKPLLDIGMNHRTHRKIAVIDGQVAFTGGINLADEYINHKEVYGHWKDTGIKIDGKGVDSYTLMFIQMWNLQSKDKILNFTPYLIAQAKNSKAYTISFTDIPLDNEALTENVYIKLINNAKDYIYITTPYLIINSMMFNALTRAAKSGVDVRILIPGIPDKKVVYNLSKNYAMRLAKSKVKVYTYDGGFIHAKSMVSDDEYSIIGTANLDYRSLYLHFECSTYAKDIKLASEIKQDFLFLVEGKSTLIKDNQKLSIFYRACCAVLRIIAPLL
jgi:cardiolipin synthase A/B